MVSPKARPRSSFAASAEAPLEPPGCVSLGSYLLGAVELTLVVLSVGLHRPSAAAPAAAVLGRRPRPPGRGSSLAVALLIWISELLGTFDLLYPVLAASRP